MCTTIVPHSEWHEFLEMFTGRHKGWLVRFETHDLETGEIVTSAFARLKSVQLDLEDRKNPRINVTVQDGNKEIKHILFRPSELTLQVSKDGNDEGLGVVSLNTVTTVRLRAAVAPELVDGVA